MLYAFSYASVIFFLLWPCACACCAAGCVCAVLHRAARARYVHVWRVWEYELYGGAQLAPHRLYVFARFLTPPKGVWEGPRAMVHLPRNTRCRFLFPPPCAFLASSLGDRSVKMYRNKTKQLKTQETHAARPHRSRVHDRQQHRRCPPPGGQQGGVAGVQHADRGRGDHAYRHHPGGEGQ
eukprot:scaffold16723_cov143-Isochrysis_galbana.AAC.4